MRPVGFAARNLPSTIGLWFGVRATGSREYRRAATLNRRKPMIDLYFWPTGNGKKIVILLEELGLPYTFKPINIGRGDQLTPAFLKISPNGRMPAIVDHEPTGGGEPISIFESGAIMTYLAEENGKFCPTAPAGNYDAA